MNEIEIVDHQIQDDAHIVAAAGPRTCAPAFDLKRRIAIIEHAGTGEDETFLMADRQHAAGRIRERDQFVSFVEIGCNGLFDQHMRAGFEKRTHDLRMSSCRRADADEIDFAEKIAPVGKRRNGMGRGDSVACFKARIGDTDKLDTGKTGVFRRMMTAKSADTDNAGAEDSGIGTDLGSQQRESPGNFHGL